MPRIEALALYELVGRRDAVVAPNAYAGIRPAESRENLLLLLSDDGHMGMTNWAQPWRSRNQPDVSWLVGVDARSAFQWRNGKVSGRNPEYARLLQESASIDVALLDLCARTEGTPLWRLLGDEARELVPAYDSTLYFEDLISPDSSPEDVVVRAQAALRRGHSALKIKVGRGLKWMPWPACTERDIEVCCAVRKAVGPGVRLMIDANKGFTGYIEDAVDFLAETFECDFLLAEELVEEHELPELRAAMEARGIQIPLAGGEDASTREWCEELWRETRLEVLQMDICHTGLVEYLSIAEFARENGARIMPHNFGSQIGVYESLHLGKVIPEFVACECDDSCFDSYEAPDYTLTDGVYSLPDTPGLGILTDDPRTAPPA